MIDPRPILDGDRADDLGDYSSDEWRAVGAILDPLATANETRVETLIRLVHSAGPGPAQAAAAIHRASSAAYRATQHTTAPPTDPAHAPQIFCACATPAGASNRPRGGRYPVLVCQTCSYVIPEADL